MKLKNQGKRSVMISGVTMGIIFSRPINFVKTKVTDTKTAIQTRVTNLKNNIYTKVDATRNGVSTRYVN